MPLPDIQLDDRRFEDLVIEAKRRIPGYTPEWTDLNESDPGITLIELFAWLGEMILWRLNRVPEKNFIKFLELIGIQLHPPTPARAELTFKLSSKELPDAILIPQGTKVALGDAVDGKPVIFETDDNLYALPGELAELQSFDGAQFKILTEANRVAGKFFFPLSELPQKDSAFYVGFDLGSKNRFPEGSFTLLLHAYTQDLIEEGKGIRAYSEQSLSGSGEGLDEDATATTTGVLADLNAAPTPVVAAWEYWAGDLPKWRKLRVTRDTTASLTRSGEVVFEAPADSQKSKAGLLRKPDDKERFWFRYRIEQVLGEGYEIPPRLEGVLINTVTATNAITVFDELLGASNGNSNQTFRVANTPVLPNPVDVQVDEGDGFTSWHRVIDFSASKRDDRHYVLDYATGEISFGDGEHGKIPRRLAGNSPDQDIPNIKVATYRWGGGGRGNAGANKITSLQSAVPYVDSVSNLSPSFGGQDEETVAEAKQRAPQTIKTRSRAVTAGDFEFLAKQTPGARIARAHAMPLHHPDYEPKRPAGAGLAATTLPLPGVITVVVVPDSLKDNVRPMPSSDTLALVGSWLNRHKLITTELYIAAPRYRRVEIEAQIVAQPTASIGQVTEALTRMLLEYFHPLHGGESGTGWEFGGTISFAETYRKILNVAGVARLKGAVKMYVDQALVASCQDISLKENELVYSDKHNIKVSYV